MDSEIIVHLLEGEAHTFPTSDLFHNGSSYARRTPNFFLRYRYSEDESKWVFAEVASAYGQNGSTVRI